MPTYQYACESCRNEFEEFQSITAKPLKTCPKCRKPRLRRLIGTGAGVIFRGSGFYQTDYRSESYKKAAEAESKPAASSTDSTAPSGGGADSTKPDSKPAEAKPSTPAKRKGAKSKTD